MKYESKKLKSRIGIALTAAAVTALPMTAFAAEDAAMDSYDLDTVEVVGQRPVSQPVETVEEPAEEPPNVYAGGQVSNTVTLGALGEKKALDVPFNIVGYTEEQIKNTQVSLLADLLANDPSISNQTLSGVSSAWNVRGFKSQQQDVQLNGLYGVAPRFYGGTESAERVDILKGPAVLLSGIAPNGSIGGVVNYVTKRAPATPLNRVTMSYGDGGIFTQQVDIGRRTADGKAGVRVNVLNRNGDSSFDEHNRTNSLAIGADYQGERYRIGFDYGLVYNKVEDQQYQVTVGDNRPAGTTLRKAWGSMPSLPHGTKFGAYGGYRSVHEHYGMISGEYDFSKDWTGFLKFGMRATKMEYLYNNFQITNTAGRVSARYQYNNQLNKADSVEAGVRGKLHTGDLEHELTVSANRIHYARYMSQIPISTATTNLWNISLQMPNNPYGWSEELNDENTLTSIGISDIISTKDGRWQTILGGRQQYVKVDTYKHTGVVKSRDSNYRKSVFTPAFALLYKPQQNVSVYANYMQGLDAGDAVVTETGASNYGEAFAPFKTTQYEIGVKYDFGQWATTFSAFDLKSPTLIADASNHYTPSGEVRHRGLEWNFFGEPVKGTRLLGGLMLLDAKYTKSKGGAYNGNRVPATSRWSGVLGLEHDLKSVPGLTFTTRLTYNSSAYINEANDFSVKPWTTWDLGARYKFNAGSTPMTVRMDVYNVTNRNYWRALINNGVFLGKERTFMLSVTADF
ncbi:TonB-dependent siderophore receptor [uncultured Selenomonas sp.]|uniref:TonB-dependent receptor n=1 Tax=uncultured Selenomonas sp. TaxID=159275 RepID=UPI0028E34852|nr:TonB-dependent siderophore receptor [uncultured Selenomonas sp.]